MSDQNEQTISWMDLAKHTANTLDIDPETVGAMVMDWVLMSAKNDPDFNWNAIPADEVEELTEMFATIHNTRQAEEDKATPAPSMYDPDGELERAEVQVIAGDRNADFYTNDSVKQFIEKRLLIAWTALKNADHLNDLAAPNLTINQTGTCTAMDIIGQCVEEIDGLNTATVNGQAIIV